MFPPPRCEVSYTTTGYQGTFSEQERAFLEQIPSVAAEFAAGGDHAMTGNGGVVAVAHDVADGAMGARPACGSRDIAVSGDAPWRNAADD